MMSPGTPQRATEFAIASEGPAGREAPPSQSASNELPAHAKKMWNYHIDCARRLRGESCATILWLSRNMDRFGSPSEEHQPLTWLRGYPIYATHLIVAVYVVSMLVTTILMAFRAEVVASWLIFDSSLIYRGQLWRYLSYGLWNPPGLGFAIDMLMLVWFGREVEKFFGRVTYLRFYFILYLVTPLLLTVIGLWWPMQLLGATGAFAVFIAFATLYPGAVLMFNILAKWAAIILISIYTLMAISGRNLIVLLSLWTTVLFAHGFVRYHQGHFNLPRLALPRRRPKLRVLPDLEPEPETRTKVSKGNSMAEVDALLDKIAQSGISSLTAKERAKLDQAREELRNRGARRE